MQTPLGGPWSWGTQGLSLQVVDEHVPENLQTVPGGLRDTLQVVDEHILEYL